MTAATLWAKCGQCRYLHAPDCEVWLHRLVTAETDASLCRTFEAHARSAADVLRAGVEAAAQNKEGTS